MEEEVPQHIPIFGHVGLFPLDTTPITWEYPSEGICVLDLFGGINTSLATVLQVGILVWKYLYVERDETIKKVSSHHLALLMRRYPKLLPRSAIRGYQQVLPSNIALLGAQDLTRVGPIDLVIARWPCQGHTQASCGEGLRDLRSRKFWEMLWVLRHFQTH
jgi:site-specific DNA-cytosine methylase